MKIHLTVNEINSSHIKAVSYSSIDNSSSLIVDFLNGASYVYYDVPFSKVFSLFSSDSVGSSFHKSITSQNYSYKRL
jgi:TRAP-type mannitol/chloroaromatic compound transport system permease small subunit